MSARTTLMRISSQAGSGYSRQVRLRGRNACFRSDQKPTELFVILARPQRMSMREVGNCTQRMACTHTVEPLL